MKNSIDKLNNINDKCDSLLKEFSNLSDDDLQAVVGGNNEISQKEAESTGQMLKEIQDKLSQFGSYLEATFNNNSSSSGAEIYLKIDGLSELKKDTKANEAGGKEL